MMRGVKKSRASEVSPKDFTPEEWDEKMKMSAGDVKRCAASVMRYVKFCSRYLGVFLGLVKRLLGDFKRGGMEIGQNSVRTLVTKLEEIKKSWCGEESSKKSDEPELGSVSKEDVMKMNKLLTFIAEGGLYGGLFAIVSISIASFFAGWVGMAVVLLVLGIIVFRFGRKKLDDILGLDEEKRGISRERWLLFVGLFLLSVALMGLIDRIVGNIIPRPIPSSYLVITVEGVIGLVLLVIAVRLFRVKAKQP